MKNIDKETIFDIRSRIKHEIDTDSMNYHGEPRVLDYQDYFHGMERAIEIIDEVMAIKPAIRVIRGEEND